MSDRGPRNVPKTSPGSFVSLLCHNTRIPSLQVNPILDVHIRAARTDFGVGGTRIRLAGGWGLARDSRKNHYGTITGVQTFYNELYLG